jgi:hypothetical protein
MPEITQARLDAYDGLFDEVEEWFRDYTPCEEDELAVYRAYERCIEAIEEKD